VLVFQEALLDQVIMDWDVPVPVGLRLAPDPEDVDAALEVDVLGTGHGDLVAMPECTRGSPTENRRALRHRRSARKYDEMTPSPERANYATGGNEFFGQVTPCQLAFTG
jgi:hypothetical protein